MIASLIQGKRSTKIWRPCRESNPGTLVYKTVTLANTSRRNLSFLVFFCAWLSRYCCRSNTNYVFFSLHKLWKRSQNSLNINEYINLINGSLLLTNYKIQNFFNGLYRNKTLQVSYGLKRHAPKWQNTYCINNLQNLKLSNHFRNVHTSRTKTILNKPLS